MPNALVWFRHDLRLDDNPALRAALDQGFTPIPVYVHAPQEEGEWSPGAASLAWLHRSLAALDADLRALLREEDVHPADPQFTLLDSDDLIDADTGEVFSRDR